MLAWLSIVKRLNTYKLSIRNIVYFNPFIWFCFTCIQRFFTRSPACRSNLCNFARNPTQFFSRFVADLSFLSTMEKNSWSWHPLNKSGSVLLRKAISIGLKLLPRSNFIGSGWLIGGWSTIQKNFDKRHFQPVIFALQKCHHSANKSWFGPKKFTPKLSHWFEPTKTPFFSFLPFFLALLQHFASS